MAEEDKMVDPLKRQVGGDHYQQYGIQPIEIILPFDLNFPLGNVVKYIARREFKSNCLEDLEKAIHYLEFEIKRTSTKFPHIDFDNIIDRWKINDRLAKVLMYILFPHTDKKSQEGRLKKAHGLLIEELKEMKNDLTKTSEILRQEDGRPKKDD